ncbi:hypothetical protein V5799_011625 [Amblyomma americanum]|uniref:Uncharacterized protein n=1 Tax=Amblyomma americanum TaxID=6943 RepID=A0AAQ4EGM8_AMBAM
MAEVGRAVEDLLASESTGSSSSSAGSRKNSCPDLHSYGGDALRDPGEASTATEAPSQRNSSRQQQQRSGVAAVTNGSGRKRANSDGTEAPCTWDTFYGWESLQLSRPPSGDAHLLSIYTERLVEAVNGSFAEELSSLVESSSPSADATETAAESDAVDSDVRGTSSGQGTTAAEQVPASAGEGIGGDGKIGEGDAVAASLEEGGLDSAGDGESGARKGLSLVRSSSWPDVAELRRRTASAAPPTFARADSCPETAAHRRRIMSGVEPCPFTGDSMDDQGAVSYDGSLYKNQQLYYESDGSGREEDRPAAERRPGSVDDVPTVEVVPEVELRISDSDHDDDDRDEGKSEAAEGTASLPELFIREDERDPPATPAARSSLSSEQRLALRDSFTLDLRSPGLARSRLNPYTIEVIANHASSPDEVLETVSTLEARLASRPLPPLVIDETEPDMGTWSSTSTAHSTSTVSRHELEEFLKSVEPPHDPPSWPQDAVTQTTPVVSRSSSFTWVTECGDELGSSKESLTARSADAAGTTLHTLAVATQSPSPVSDASSSSCDAPPTPLTPRASPSSQEVSSDLSDSAAHGTTTAATRARPLQNGASPSLPTLDGPECAQPSTHRQLSLEEKPQIRSLSRPTAKATEKKTPEVTSSSLPWTSPQQLSHKASSAPVLLKNKPPTCLGDAGQKCSLAREATAASAGSTPEEEVKVREHVVFWPRRYFAKPSSRR